MILQIEGPRGSGKTFLINKFLEECNDPRVEYYKFYFADHVKSLGLQSLDRTPALHYYSLGNIMTIMEMNLRPEYRDKIWIFDRAILSAYTWAILRNRLTDDVARSEYLNLLGSDLFSNYRTLLVSVNGQTDDLIRSKDLWDAAHSTSEELSIMTQLAELGSTELANSSKNNLIGRVINQFDESSVASFNHECYKLLGIKPNK
jgi:hypothetical protein